MCAFYNYVLVNGVLYAFGMLYVELLDQFGEDKDVTAWIGSIQLGVVNFGGKWSFFDLVVWNLFFGLATR